MKNEVILVNLPPGQNHKYDNAGSIYPATGVLLIGTILKKNGYSVSLIDGAVHPDYEEIVLGKLSENTAFVGFSTMTSQIIMAYDLSAKIKKKKPEALIVCGGAHPTLFPEQTVSNPYIDIAVVNEGAATVLDIMEYINGNALLGRIKGIAYQDCEGKTIVTPDRALDTIDEVPFFDFDLIDVDKYLNATSVYERELNPEPGEKIKLMPIVTGLGCCFRCAFCINVILKRKYRIRDAESIVSEMKRLKGKYGANAFLFLDEDFCINKKRLAEFIDLVKKENVDFKGRIWTRVSYFRTESFRKLIPELADIGMRSIAMGAESGSQRILDYICKDIKREDIILAAKELAKVNITPRFSFIAGIEGEKKNETIATYKLCGELLAINPRTDIAGPFTFRYYPGSPIFRQMVEKYDIKMPSSIDEWKAALNDDGSLMIDSKDWMWPGFFKYTASMHSYIAFYVWHFARSEARKKFFAGFCKKLVLWRLSCGENLFFIDFYLFRFVRRLKKSIKSLLSGGKTVKSEGGYAG